MRRARPVHRCINLAQYARTRALCRPARTLLAPGPTRAYAGCAYTPDLPRAVRASALVTAIDQLKKLADHKGPGGTAAHAAFADQLKAHVVVCAPIELLHAAGRADATTQAAHMDVLNVPTDMAVATCSCMYVSCDAPVEYLVLRAYIVHACRGARYGLVEGRRDRLEVLRDGEVQAHRGGVDPGPDGELLHVHAWPGVVQRAPLGQCDHLHTAQTRLGAGRRAGHTLTIEY